MAVNLVAPKELKAVRGCQLASVAGGLRYQDRDDLLLIRLDEGSQTVAVFTRNKFAAAPVAIAKAHLEKSPTRAILINAGNANAGTGALGLENCQRCCHELAQIEGIEAEQVLPFSTGVIGEQFDMERMLSAIHKSSQPEQQANWLQAAEAIMTTDTVAKAVSKSVEIDGEQIVITGIAKGSGMICPDMATMLAFVVTDAVIDAKPLNRFLRSGADRSFNRITVDSDTSTNDALVLTATGQSGIAPIVDDESDRTQRFYQALESLLIELATAIIRDGEGATKFVTVNVENGKSIEDCKAVAYSIAHSPLVKTALFASDPNWGRLLMAIGKAPTQDMDISLLNISVNGVALIEAGDPAKSYTEELGKQAFEESEIQITVDLVQGQESYHVWTSDLSHDYVSINADYRS